MMQKISFEWDERKAEANLRKHGVSFEEAKSIFFDEEAIEFYDDEHSEWEDRFLMLGVSHRMRLLLIVHCYRDADRTIRIISARKATRKEAKHYGGRQP